MGVLRLYFETGSKKLAAGLNLPLGFAIPALAQEDKISLELSAITRISELTSPLYEELNLAGWSARVAIGTAASVLAQQNIFTLDATSKKLLGTLDLNTAGINALADRAPNIYFELLFSDANGNPYRQRYNVLIEKAVWTTGSIITPPGDVALGELKADRLYLRKEGRAGEGFILTSADGTKQGFIYWHDDGSFRAEPIS